MGLLAQNFPHHQAARFAARLFCVCAMAHPDFRLKTAAVDLVTHWRLPEFHAPAMLAPDELAVLRQALGQDLEADRAAAERLEAAMLELPQVDIPVEHFFGDQVYLRKILIPRGTMATGRIQKFEHISIVISGDMTVWNEHDGLVRVKGPAITVVKPGTKRVGYAHEDTLWATAHGTGFRDIENMVGHLTAASYAEYEAHCLQLANQGKAP